MSTRTLGQRTLTVFLSQDDHLLTQISAFLVDRQSQSLSSGTLGFYRQKLDKFAEYCDINAIKHITEISSNDLREYLLWLESTSHNPGGVHAFYRTIRTFLYWWENEIEPDDWKNPIRKVRAPRVDTKPLEPTDISIIKSMLETCDRHSLTGRRDRAAFIFLMDTGVRAGEFVELDLADCEYPSGAVTVRRGKGGKPRTVFMGRKTLKVVRAYLRFREDKCPALWVTDEGTRIKYSGLRSMVVRRAKKVGVKPPSLHSFRRFFALQCLRNGMDIFTLQKAMGHADLTVLRRYLAQTTEDVAKTHRIAGSVDNADW